MGAFLDIISVPALGYGNPDRQNKLCFGWRLFPAGADVTFSRKEP